MIPSDRPRWISALWQPRWWLPAQLAFGALLAACYVGCVVIGDLMSDPTSRVVPVYPAAGFAVAVLLRFGWRRWLPWTILAVFAGAASEGMPGRYCLVAAGNILAITLAAWVIARFASGTRFLDRPEDVFRFVAAAGVLGLVSAAIGISVIIWLGEASFDAFASHGVGWAVGDIVGTLLIAPPLVAWSEADWRSPENLPRRWMEIIPLFVASAAVTQFAFGGWPFEPHHFSLEYLTIPMLMWAAFRFPRRGGTATTLAVATLAVLDTLAGRGSFAMHNHAYFVLLQIYLGAVSMLVLVISAGVREHEAQACELREAFAAADAARGEAERAARVKSAFLSRMSHELRTPLNAILGFAQILKIQGGQDAIQDECSAQILHSGRHLLSLVNEVLDLASLENRRLPLRPEPVEMLPLIRECLHLQAETARARGVSCHVETSCAGSESEADGNCGDALGTGEPEACCVVLADRERLRQVLTHLLANAIKFNVMGGRVTVSCSEAPPTDAGAPPHWRVRVADTGRGISPSDQVRLFAPFHQLAADGPNQKSSGLGLAVTKSLIDAMGGRIGVESAPGFGSVFWVDLPATDPKPIEALGFGGEEDVKPFEAATAPDSDSATVAGPAATLLYVEDNLSNLQLIRTAFDLYFPDLRLLVAKNGRDGLRLARQHRPGLILLDVQLPDIDGDVVLSRLRANIGTRDIPVVILSADAAPASRQRLLKAGAQDYLEKPLEMPTFLTLINRAFRADAEIPQMTE